MEWGGGGWWHVLVALLCTYLLGNLEGCQVDQRLLWVRLHILACKDRNDCVETSLKVHSLCQPCRGTVVLAGASSEAPPRGLVSTVEDGRGKECRKFAGNSGHDGLLQCPPPVLPQTHTMVQGRGGRGL